MAYTKKELAVYPLLVLFGTIAICIAQDRIPSPWSGGVSGIVILVSYKIGYSCGKRETR
jgi:hypothetical protein